MDRMRKYVMPLTNAALVVIASSSIYRSFQLKHELKELRQDTASQIRILTNELELKNRLIASLELNKAPKEE